MFSLSAITYLLFQKKMLSKGLSKIVAKIFFYPTMPITAVLRLKNYWTELDDTLILGCAPFAALGHVKSMYDIGVRGVVNLCDEYHGPQDAYDSFGIKQLYLPTVDHFESSLSQIQEGVKFINHYKSLGQRVYVHCKAGHGRGATVALAWLMSQSPEVDAKDMNTILCGKRRARKTIYKQKIFVKFLDTLSASQANKDKTT